jgi:hypothetical protein
MYTLKYKQYKSYMTYVVGKSRTSATETDGNIGRNVKNAEQYG